MVASTNVEASSAAEADSSKCQENSTAAGQKHTTLSASKAQSPQPIERLRSHDLAHTETTLQAPSRRFHMSCSAAVVK